MIATGTIQKLCNEFLVKCANIQDPKLKELSNIQSFSGRIEFCKNNFQKLKAGSSRIVYDYNSQYVLKLAKNAKGLDQNSTESDGFIQQNYKQIVANVIDSDPNNKWIISQKAYKLTPNEFKTLMGFSLEELCEYLKAKFVTYKQNSSLDDNEFVQELTDLMANFNMGPGDICRISSWSKVNGKPVLIDYGLTNEIFETHYAR